jgi:DNA-binding NarL/FixJ family response regulator
MDTQVSESEVPKGARMKTAFSEEPTFMLAGKRDMVIWRLVTVSICLTWMICFSIRIFVLGINARTQDLMSPPVFISFHFGIAALLIAWIVKPHEFYIPALFCWLWGLMELIDGGSLGATALHLFGYLFALKRGYFRTHKTVKIVVAAVVLIAAIVSQVRYSVVFLIWHGLQVLDFTLVAAAVALVFYSDFQEFLRQRAPSALPPEAAQPEAASLFLYIDPLRCSIQDLAILRQILAGGKYESIAHKYGMAVSTLKRRVRVLYTVIGVLDRADFMVRYSRYTIELSPESVPANAHR